jgi:hypothetical protein
MAAHTLSLDTTLRLCDNGGGYLRWSRTGHELVYRSGDQLMSVSYSVKDSAFVAEPPRLWIAQEHVIVMLLNFADELRRRLPTAK